MRLIVAHSGQLRLYSVWILAAVLGLASIDKLVHYDGFVTALQHYVILPRSVAPFLAIFVILSELWIAGGLLLRNSRRIACVSSAALLVVFALALGVNYYYDQSAPCGCSFTFTLGDSSPVHIALNLILAGLALTLPIDEVNAANTQLSSILRKEV